MKKILLICNESNNVINFRSELIQFLIKRDFSIDVICGDDKRRADIESLGVKNVFVVHFKNRGINPFSLVEVKKQFINIIKHSKPDIVFTFQAKPNILGASVASKCNIKMIFSMVEGLGDPFQPRNFKGKIIRFLISKMYKKSLKTNSCVFFLNNDDKDEFVKRKIVSEKNSVVLPGIGIDTKKNIINIFSNQENEKIVMMLSRLTYSKGIFDFCKIAHLVKRKRPDVVFELFGDEQDITIKDLMPYIESGDIRYCGYSNDPIKELSRATVYVSTSCYREGFPRTFLEAMILKKPIISTNTIGSKDAIIDGVTGYILNMHDVDGFVEKILSIIDDEEGRFIIGNSAYHYCVEHFDSDIVNEIIFGCLKNNTLKF